MPVKGQHHRLGRIHLPIPIVAIFAMMLIFVAVANAQTRLTDVSDPDNGGALQLKKGDDLQLRLKSTPGTGYSWQIDQIDKTMLIQQGAPIFVPPPKQIPGAEGHTVWHFLAAAPGRSELDLEYIRPWEKNAAPARTFKLLVSIK
jgi:inhibitor of cysteine peptidase